MKRAMEPWARPARLGRAGEPGDDPSALLQEHARALVGNRRTGQGVPWRAAGRGGASGAVPVTDPAHHTRPRPPTAWPRPARARAGGVAFKKLPGVLGAAGRAR